MESKRRRVQENGVAEVSVDDVRALVEPFAKEQLVDIVIDAALGHANVLNEIRLLADKDPAHRKLFVRGLSSDTTPEVVKSVFSQYGEIEECQVVMDKNSGKSKGYGFVTFKHMDGAQRALKDPSKRISGRMTVCQLASAGSSAQANSSQDLADRKIYVANVPHDLSAEKLLTLFSEFGEIEEGPLGFDKQTGKSRGFAIFIFKSVDSVKRALEEPVKTLDGHQLSCKLASEGQKPKSSFSGQLDLGDLASAQVGGLSALSHNALSGLLPLTPGILGQQQLNSSLAAQGLLSSLTPSSSLASLNAALYPSIAQQLAAHSSLGSSYNSPLTSSLNSTLPYSLNPSLSQGGSQGLSQTFGQTPSSTGLSSYGLHGLGGYGSQVGGLGGSTSLYGVSPSSVGSQAGLLQGGGHNSLSTLQSSQLGQQPGSRAQSLSSYYNN